MIHIRKWALALCLVLLSLSSSNAQTVDSESTLSSTGNVLNLGGGLPWAGTVTGAAGGFSGGNVPAYNPSTGNIIFGYMQGTASQMVAINQALANAGTGIQLSGYRYSWQINNDLDNRGGNRGTVIGNVSLTGSGGNVLESFNYDYSKTNLPSFTTFSGTQLFENKYSLASVSNITVSFTGKDQNWWAGYYGPRVHVNEFSLLYSAAPTPPVVDPCSTNPLSSPSCAGYGAAFVTKTNTTASTGGVTITPTAVSIGVPEAATASSPATNVGGVQLSTTGSISAPDNIPQALKDVQASVQQSQASAPPANASVQQPQQSNKSAPNMSLIMSLIGQIQAADRATQSAAVQNANQVAATSAARAQEQAMATVDTLNTMSAASGQAAQDRAMQSSQTSMSVPQQSTAGSTVLMQGPTVTTLQSLMAATSQSTGSTATYTIDYSSSNKNQLGPVYSNQQLSTMLSIQQPVAETAPVQFAKIETRSLEPDVPVMPVASAMPRGTSVTEIVETRANIETAQTEQSTETVKKNVQTNELAGGVDIASIATQPRGFDVYSITVMKDGTFYAPKDIYGNQKTIDNARALRSLSSDRLHQEMVDQQYKGK
jgi:hypothetical protein